MRKYFNVNEDYERGYREGYAAYLTEDLANSSLYKDCFGQVKGEFEERFKAEFEEFAKKFDISNEVLQDLFSGCELKRGDYHTLFRFLVSSTSDIFLGKVIKKLKPLLSGTQYSIKQSEEEIMIFKPGSKKKILVIKFYTHQNGSSEIHVNIPKKTKSKFIDISSGWQFGYSSDDTITYSFDKLYTYDEIFNALESVIDAFLEI